MAKAPDVTVVINSIQQLDSINLEKPPTSVQLSAEVLSEAKANAGVQAKIKALMVKDVKVSPYAKGRNPKTYIPPPKQTPNQISKELGGYRLHDIKTKTLTGKLYSTTRPRPLRGLVATVFGATGFLGIQVAQILANRGAQVVCPVRPNIMGMHGQFRKDHRNLRVLGEQGQVFPVLIDSTNFDDLTKCVNRSHMVFNCTGAGHNFPHMYDSFGLEGTHTNLARNIARACTMRGVPRLVHVSHVNANPSSDNDIFKYKGWGEEAVRSEFPNAIVIRPTDMFGHQDTFTNYMLHVWCSDQWPFNTPAFWLIKDKEYVETQPVWVTDVARGMVRAAMRDSCFGETIELGGPQKYKLVELMRYIESLYTPIPARIKIYTQAEAKLRLENRPLRTLERTWFDMHLRQDAVTNPNAKGWEEVEVEKADLQKIENMAAEWIAPRLFYMDSFAWGSSRVDPVSQTLGVSREKVAWGQLAILGLGAASLGACI